MLLVNLIRSVIREGSHAICNPRTGATTRGRLAAEAYHLALLVRCHQSRAIIPSRLDIYMAIAGAPTQQPGCAPRGQN